MRRDSTDALPTEWVEKVFEVMRATYGAAFDRMWAAPDGVDPVRHVAAVKAAWARELAGLAAHPEALRYALDNLPARPPNLVEFAQLCARRPEPMTRALPVPKPDPARVREALARMRQVQAVDPKAWARELRDRELLHGRMLANGRRMTFAQKTMWRAALQTDVGADRRPEAPNAAQEARSGVGQGVGSPGHADAPQGDPGASCRTESVHDTASP